MRNLQIITFTFKCILFCLAAGILFFSFTYNSLLHIDSFEQFQRDTEEYVFSNMYYTHRDGILSTGSFLSRFRDKPYTSQLGLQGFFFAITYHFFAPTPSLDFSPSDIRTGDTVILANGEQRTVQNNSSDQAHYYRIIVLNGMKLDPQSVGFPHTITIRSRSNAVATLIPDFQSNFDWDRGVSKSSTALYLKETYSASLISFIPYMHDFAAMLSVCTFLLFVVIIWKEFGLLSSVIAYAGIVSSSWINLFARNVFYMLSTMFLPFLFAWIFYDRIRTQRGYHLFLWSIFLLVMFRSFFGYEFITNVVLSPLIPVMYFSLKNQHKPQAIIRDSFYVLIAGTGGVVLAIVLQTFLNGIVFSDLSTALSHIVERMNYRSFEQFAITASPLMVLHSYLNIGVLLLPLPNELKSVTANILLFVLISLMIISIAGMAWRMLHRKSSINAFESLIVSTALSFIASISWLVCAKNHAFIHMHMDVIVFAIPFQLMLFVCIGQCIMHIISFFSRMLPMKASNSHLHFR